MTTLGEIIEERAAELGDRVYLSFEDQEITYGDSNARANSIANSLLQMGVRKGDKVCNMMPNCPEFIYSWFGVAKIGAVEVPVNTALRGESLKHVINHCDARAIIAGARFLEQIEFVQEDLVNLQDVIVFTDGGTTGGSAPPLRFNIVPYSQLLAGSPGNPRADVRPSDPVTIMFTSGTTGPAKGVVLPHNYCRLQAMAKVRAWRLTRDDVLYTCLPIFHTNGRFTTVITGLVAGARVALSRGFSARGFWNEIRRYGATEFGTVGAIMSILMKQPERPDDADNPVRIVHGGPLSPEQHREFERRFGLKLLQGFSMTECSLCSVEPYVEENRRFGTSGLPLEEYDMRVFEEDDTEAPPGTVGELVIRPKYPYSMITEYYRMPEKTVEAFRNLWFHTGDYAYKDEDGYLFYVDRKKDALRRRGEMVSSYEVERVIDFHPSVEESAAIGVPSELGEDDIMVRVKLKAGEKLQPEELLAYCEKRMADFMLPRYIEFVESLPRTATHKIEKHKLRLAGLTSTTWDREKAGYKIKRV